MLQWPGLCYWCFHPFHNTSKEFNVINLPSNELLVSLIDWLASVPVPFQFISLERTRKEIFVSAVRVALWHHIDVMTETLSSRVTTGCAWGTGTMEHAPWCPLSPVHIPHLTHPSCLHSPHVTSDNKLGTPLCSYARRQRHALQVD